MLNLNFSTLQAVADKALVDAAAHPRWINAIGRALIELDQNPWIERNPEGHGLVIASPSGKVYTSNGICQCEAHAHGRACWHRAASRLVRLHDEMQARVCELPDNLCSLEEPCAEHAPAAAAYRAAETRTPMGQRLAAARRPLMAREDAETARLAAKGEMRAQLENVQATRAAARTALALVNELF
jgi:hypothetical protein